MGPDNALPLPPNFGGGDPEEYVEALLRFGTTSTMLRTLCGGVHILDFFTREPDLYSLVLPEEWRLWFARKDVEVMDVLDLCMRMQVDEATLAERFEAQPPESFLGFVKEVRGLLLRRDWEPVDVGKKKGGGKLPRHIALGMNVKKQHEVQHVASFVDRLARGIEEVKGEKGAITHIADFGSGQNYLGRALASEPYGKRIIGIESRKNNIEGARGIDVLAGLAPKKVVLRNKKEWRKEKEKDGEVSKGKKKKTRVQEQPKETFNGIPKGSKKAKLHLLENGTGSIQYVEHRLEDGNLAHVIQEIPADQGRHPNVMVISLHSCGNLVHHGLRSLTLNPAVKAVAMIGCCYNLMTERLGPPSYKLPQLRPNHPRLEATANAFDPHGFPMSERYATYPVPGTDDIGVRLNITARMMAVQAPQNWGPADSEAFFTRHFFRALLQRVFLDHGVVEPPPSNANGDNNNAFQNGRAVGGSVSPAGCSSGGEPIVIGSLKKSCYTNFVAYVRGAVTKIEANKDQHPEKAELVKKNMANITDEEIRRYEEEYRERKKELAVVWSLMAFSAGVIEAMIVVDRWLWLKEQKEVESAWVEPVFDYKLSPRNLVVVGVKK
ncbi:methyltransferase domain-containing protein [Macrophomina phaseolina]|uniref:Methyltransferase domain-containing protein n=1 Tax=Macrophomina phaseolina TaxID=35725 RepID=A0ABQ8G233_9PEZI|nr:methyltransferase domain-containing protein [Macrophomina phaseolina]